MSIKYTERLAEAGIEPSVGSVGEATTMLSPRRSTVSTKPRSSIDGDRGGRSKPSSSQRWNGWTGSTTGGSWSPSATSRQPKPSNATTPGWNNQPWRRDSNQMASEEPGAVHIRAIEVHSHNGFDMLGSMISPIGSEHRSLNFRNPSRPAPLTPSLSLTSSPLPATSRFSPTRTTIHPLLLHPLLQTRLCPSSPTPPHLFSSPPLPPLPPPSPIPPFPAI